MSYETILVEKKDGIAKVTINLPNIMNALVQKLIDELGLITKDLEEDDNIKAVILTGTGKAFCAGGDLNRFKEGFTLIGAIQYVKDIHPWVLDFINLSKPTIAAVNGHAAGAGLCVAMMCDITIASEQAKFSSAFVNVGIVPDLAGMYYLPRLVGLQRAKELVFTGKVIDGNEAYRMGLVNQVVEHGKLEETAYGIAHKIANGPTFAIKTSKKILNKSIDMNFNELIDMEAYIQGICFQTEDANEAISAFLEKRKPIFKGK